MKKQSDNLIRNSATLKIISIGVLLLVFLLPISMITSLMKEREARRDSVVQEINQKWGNSQTITGPFITIPYKEYFKDINKELKFNTKFFHVLPERLKITGQIAPHVRYRGIYEAVLYNIRLDVSGEYNLTSASTLNIEADDILWEQATFSIGINDMRGIQENIEINYEDKKYVASPGLKTTDIASAGVSSVIPLSPKESHNTFSLQLNINGSEQIHFVPVAKETGVEIESSWPSPSFNGAFLPTKREVTDSGFAAVWKVLHLNRNFPQSWQGNQYNVDGASFGVKLLITADIYQKSMRISKYALMFVIFTFSAFFFAEITNKTRIHPIQYLLIGLAVILFYILLLSISEHIKFDYAYLLSATTITFLIAGYSKGVIRNKYFTLTVFSVLSVLYSYLYIVLQLEDYALIMGSMGLLIVLGSIMYITRKFDWYTLEKKKDD